MAFFATQNFYIFMYPSVIIFSLVLLLLNSFYKVLKLCVCVHVYVCT